MKTQRIEDKKKVITTIGNNKEPLPLDIWIEILTKLPAKSILKFSCVSKQWCSIIRSRLFINSFLSTSLSRPRFLLSYGIVRGIECELLFLSFPLHHQDSNLSSMISKHHMPDSRISPRNDTVICNSVRGIIFVSLGLDRFVICNPTTRQVIKVPKDPTGSGSKQNMCLMYLGYDISNDQYKIWRMIKGPHGSVEHNVCTLGGLGQSSFSSWRRVESSIGYYQRNTNAVCINGVVYYGAAENPTKRFVIVSFDAGSERLVLMEAPTAEKLDELIRYQGKLASFSVTNNNSSYSLWILDDDKKQIWSTKTGVFPPSFCDLYRYPAVRICGSSDDEEIIFVSAFIGEAFQLFYYDLEKNNVSKRVRIEGIAGYDEFRSPIDIQHLSRSCDHVDNIIYF